LNVEEKPSATKKRRVSEEELVRIGVNARAILLVIHYEIQYAF
jgi:hypothetical protein